MQVEGIKVNVDEGGSTDTRGGIYCVILHAGYLGSSFWGMLLILASTNIFTARITAGCFGVALLIVLFVAKNWTLRGLCIGFIVFLAIIWILQFKTGVRILRYIILFIGVMNSLFSAGYVLARLVAAKGLAWVLAVYGVPLLVVNSFLVIITYLQHTHPSLPHYDSTEWDWLRGASATVDRDYRILNKVFHNITDTHIAHHLFSTMPHYHAMEATNAIKPILGEYYQMDRTPFIKAMWREAKECIYVEQDEGEKHKGVYWYNSKF